MLETKVDTIGERVNGVHDKLDYLIGHFDTRISKVEDEQLSAATERRTILKLVAAGFAVVPVLITIIAQVLPHS